MSMDGSTFGSEFAFDPSGAGLPTDEWSDEALAAEDAVTNPGPAGPTPEPASNGAQPPQPQPQPTPQPTAPEPSNEPQVPPEQTPPAQPAQPQPQAPEGQQPSATPQEQAAQTGGEQTPPAKKYLGKYDTPEQLEEGYKNIRRLQVQTSERMQQLEQERQEDRRRMAQVLQQLQPVLSDPEVQARLRGGQPLIPQTPGQPQHQVDVTQLSPEQLQAYLDQQVATQVQQQVQQVSQQQQTAQAQGEVRMVVQTFMNSHPDIQPGTELDYAINDVVTEFQTDSQGQHRPELFPYSLENLEAAYTLAQDPGLHKAVVELDLVPDAETLEIAREAVKNPAFFKQLKANPTYVDSPEGLELAREMAALPGLYANTAAQAAPPSPEAQRLAAQVETGGTGAPVTSAPGAVPQDEFDEALASWQSTNDNIFGLRIPTG